MGTIYQFNQLVKLEFQLDKNDVLMSCVLVQNKVKNEVDFIISHSELNKIMSNIQYFNPEIELSSLMHTFQLSEDECLISIELREKQLNNSWMNEYEFQDTYKEIRA